MIALFAFLLAAACCLADTAPYKFIPQLFIESNGVQLSAELFLPVSSSPSAHFPSLIESNPYHHRDLSLSTDYPQYAYLASQGYAVIRVDVRGTGESTGVFQDEYSLIELEDIRNVVGWARKQSWSNGKVGLVGISWSGFNALQVAFLQGGGKWPVQPDVPQPKLHKETPEEKAAKYVDAIMAIGFTDNRYATDIHFNGGIQLCADFTWSATAQELMPLVADPSLFPDANTWRQSQLERAKNTRIPASLWLKHQRRDAFWQYGSVDQEPSAIKIPTLLVDGFTDLYTDPVFRLMETLSNDWTALVGPWAHIWPQSGYPGPAINFLDLLVRWFDPIMRGQGKGLAGEAKVQLYIQEREEFAPAVPFIDGQWIGLSDWPTKGKAKFTDYSVDYKTKALVLGSTAGNNLIGTLHSYLFSAMTTTFTAEIFATFQLPSNLPTNVVEQIYTPGLSFTSDPFTKNTTFVGLPQVTVKLSSDQPVGQIIALIYDVNDAGSASYVSWGAINLAYRDDTTFTKPKHLPVRQLNDKDDDAIVSVTFPLKATSHVFRVGSRIRIVLENAFFPLLWPSPVTPNFNIYACTVSMPNLPTDIPKRNVSHELFETPVALPNAPYTVVAPSPNPPYSSSYDPTTGILAFSIPYASEVDQITEVDNSTWTWRRYTNDTFLANVNGDPQSVQVNSEHQSHVERTTPKKDNSWVGSWTVTTSQGVACNSSTGAFLLTGGIQVFENDTQISTHDFGIENIDRVFA